MNPNVKFLAYLAVLFSLAVPALCQVATPHLQFVAERPMEVEQANGYQYPASDHVMAVLAQSAVPQPKKVDHVMEILKLEREPVKKVDHLMEILKIEHAAAAASSLEQANGYQFPANDHVMAIMAYSAVPKPKKVDHVMEILKLEHEAVRLVKKVDHVVEILKLEHRAAKKVDHLMEILKLEHAAAVRDVDFVKKIRKMSTHKKKVDHVMEILSFEHAAATRLGKRVDHLMEILKLEHAAATADVPKKPKKVDHVVEILKLEHNAARLGKKVDHVVEILKLEHAAAVRAARPKAKGRTVQPKKVDHVMEILKMEYREPEINQLAQAARNMHKLYKAQEKMMFSKMVNTERKARKKVDHIMEILKLEHQAVQNKELEFRARVQALLAARHQSIQGSNGLLSWQEV